MARLNELPVAPEVLETLHRRLYRQNRELAKSNNVRALRIRELENDCASMLSENLDLRGRILELERQIEDNEARRIADQALAIKAKLESQLAEWGLLIAGLGLEAPVKRNSPATRRSIRKRRTSFSASRPSPSRRRLREVAREIEELGHISENKSYQRRSMNPEQILALRSEADISSDSIDLGPPPMSHFVEEDGGLDSPNRLREVFYGEALNADEEKFHDNVASPDSIENASVNSSPIKSEDHTILALKQPQLEENTSEVPAIQPAGPVKAGSKRKRAARDDGDDTHEDIVHHNKTAKASAEKSSIRPGPTGDNLTEMCAEEELGGSARKPLANKSTNDDISCSRRRSKTKSSLLDETSPSKTATAKSKATKIKSKPTSANKAENIAILEIETTRTTPALDELTTPITEAALLAPDTPEPAVTIEAPRGGTPPPADISFNAETLRPSRRNRATISYAEPNLRDKMRRPTKALLDAVAGEPRNRRRASHGESNASDPVKAKSKPNLLATDDTPATDTVLTLSEPENLPASPLAEKSLPLDDLPSSVVTERRKRNSNAVSNPVQADGDSVVDNETDTANDVSIASDPSELKDADVYEFTSNSPQDDKPKKDDKPKRKDGKRINRRQTTSSRRSSTAADGENDRSTSRRRSMMI